jgi:hypothetical protein
MIARIPVAALSRRSTPVRIATAEDADGAGRSRRRVEEDRERDAVDAGLALLAVQRIPALARARELLGHARGGRSACARCARERHMAGDVVTHRSSSASACASNALPMPVECAGLRPPIREVSLIAWPAGSILAR